MSITLVQHRHCPACGKAILPSRDTCDEQCAAQWEKMKSHRKWLLRFNLLLAVIVVSFYVIYLPQAV